jgi:cholesterol oxidase
VSQIRPLGAADGSDGYRLFTERSGSILRKRKSEITAGAVIISAGAVGSNSLLANCLASGALPRLSGRLGYVVRTNSESIQAVTAPDDSRDFSRRHHEPDVHHDDQQRHPADPPR